MILMSNLRKTSLLELNVYLMKSFEKRIYDNLQIQQKRNEQLLNLLNKSKEELIQLNSEN
jgi:hypothetical protein